MNPSTLTFCSCSFPISQRTPPHFTTFGNLEAAYLLSSWPCRTLLGPASSLCARCPDPAAEKGARKKKTKKLAHSPWHHGRGRTLHGRGPGPQNLCLTAILREFHTPSHPSTGNPPRRSMHLRPCVPYALTAIFASSMRSTPTPTARSFFGPGAKPQKEPR